MKKNLLLLIILPLLISCSQDSIDEIPESKKAILFSDFNNRITKAANDKDAAYKIYAMTSLNPSKWYIDDVVTANKLKNGPYYWLQNGTMDFFAYAPASSKSYKISGTFPNITITYTVPKNADEDFTVATPIKGVNYNNENNKAVELQFKHMLSKVSTVVELSQELKDAGYEIKVRGTTNLSVGITTYKTTINTGTWDYGFQDGRWTTYSGRNTYYILPQVGHGAKIQLMGVIITKNRKDFFSGDLTPYTLSETETGTYNSHEYDKLPLHYLDEGESNVLKFTINNMSTTKEGKEYIIVPDLTFSAHLAEGAGWFDRGTIQL